MNIWGRLGISVAIVAIFCIVMNEFFQSTAYYEAHRWDTCAVFLGVGLFGWMWGRVLNIRWRKVQEVSAREAQAEDESTQAVIANGPFILFNVAYWGVMLIFLGITIIFLTPRPREGAKPAVVHAAVVKPKPHPQTNAAALPPAPIAENTNHFPEIKLQGVSYRKANPSALINGKTFFAGDHIGKAKIIVIDPYSVTLEVDGEFRVFALIK